MYPLLSECMVHEKANLVMYVTQVLLVRGMMEMILFFIEILILFKYSEEISAHAQRINTSRLQCKICVCFLFWMNLFLLDYEGTT